MDKNNAIEKIYNKEIAVASAGFPDFIDDTNPELVAFLRSIYLAGALSALTIVSYQENSFQTEVTLQ